MGMVERKIAVVDRLSYGGQEGKSRVEGHHRNVDRQI